MLDNVSYKAKPDCNRVCATIKHENRAKLGDLSLDDVVSAVQCGKAVIPAVLSGTRADDFIEQTLIMIDIDNSANEDLARKTKRDVSQLTENERIPLLTVEKALNICRDNGLNPCFYYHTFSHSEEKPKFRLVFAMNEPVTDKGKRDTIHKTIIGLFAQADKGAVNADRIFMGTDKKAVIIDKDARISIEDIYRIYRPPIRALKNFKSESALDELKQNFDLLGYMRGRNGGYKELSGTGYMFYDCELCGHHNDLVYYADTNTFYCFSCSKGGTVVDYIMLSENVDVKTAIDQLCELSGKDLLSRREPFLCNDDIFKIIEKIRPDKNYDMNDLSYGRLFAHIFKDVAHYNTTTKSWYLYNGKVWIEDAEFMGVNGLAKKLCDALLVYGSQMPDGSAKRDFIKWTNNYTTLNRRETMIRDARTEHYISKENLDQDVYAFNCLNGTLNLETFKFHTHSSNDFLSKISNVYYDPGVRCERWERFMDEVMEGNMDKIKYFQKLLGYSLTGLTEIEQCFILYGNTTRNGKSTVVETIGYMMGNGGGYALTIQPETLATKINKDSRTHSTDIARLKGCRFVNAPEPPLRMLLDNSLIKNWTGGDTVSAREIYEKQTEFRPMFKLFINTNHLPLITDKTLFTSNRINVITFDRHFEQSEQDLTLKGTLRKPENISGIFNWCIAGLKDYYAEGLIPPQCVVEANNEYRENSDKIQQFIDDCLIESDKNIAAGGVYGVYKNWCDECEIRPLSKSNFFDEMKVKHIFAKTGTVCSQTVKNVILGYELADAESPF